MKIVFALIVAFSHSRMGEVAVKVGEYEKYAQCQTQGQKLVDDGKPQTIIPRAFICVPVNATGGK